MVIRVRKSTKQTTDLFIFFNNFNINSFLVFLNFFNKRSIKHIEDLMKNQLEELSTQTINIFNERINTSLAYVEGMARVFSKFEPLNSEASLEMLVELTKESVFDRILVVDLNGIATYGDGQTIDVSDREYYQKAMIGESEYQKQSNQS